jgi:hypothetical protein
MSDIPQWTDKMTPYQRCEFGMALATMNRLIDNATEYRRTYNITIPAKSMELLLVEGMVRLLGGDPNIDTTKNIFGRALMLDKFHHMMVMSLMSVTR